MSLAMSPAERDAFLADLHVGVISIEQPGASPLSVPIWYDYSPEVGVWVITGDTSLKARQMRAAGRFTLVAQSEVPPVYCYVSVEGPVIETRPADLEGDLRPMARRYFGEELGDQYTAATGSEGQSVYVMRPERWRTVDYRKSALL
ncbi:pyridoxamine 5'-phosphate oxidase family protein [Myxococcota bacterium]|nr:pyridoxamine 5'-phosphate oxidase family protein [Myxococcota bacterium]